MLALKFVKLEILSTSFIDFLYDKFGEFKVKIFGFYRVKMYMHLFIWLSPIFLFPSLKRHPLSPLMSSSSSSTSFRVTETYSFYWSFVKSLYNIHLNILASIMYQLKVDVDKLKHREMVVS